MNEWLMNEWLKPQIQESEVGNGSHKLLAG
jgi:hypothetical protein